MIEIIQPLCFAFYGGFLLLITLCFGPVELERRHLNRQNRAQASRGLRAAEEYGEGKRCAGSRS